MTECPLCDLDRSSGLPLPLPSDSSDQYACMGPGADYVFTLVHGTFARNAPWTRPESNLCRRLSELASPGAVRRSRVAYASRRRGVSLDPFIHARWRPFAGPFTIMALLGLAPSIWFTSLWLFGALATLAAWMAAYRWPSRLLKALRIGDLSRLNLVIVRTPAGETSAVFAASHVLGWLNTRVYAFVALLSQGLSSSQPSCPFAR